MKIVKKKIGPFSEFLKLLIDYSTSLVFKTKSVFKGKMLEIYILVVIKINRVFQVKYVPSLKAFV